jgi:hypothetical protein
MLTCVFKKKTQSVFTIQSKSREHFFFWVYVLHALGYLRYKVSTENTFENVDNVLVENVTAEEAQK